MEEWMQGEMDGGSKEAMQGGRKGDGGREGGTDGRPEEAMQDGSEGWRKG